MARLFDYDYTDNTDEDARMEYGRRPQPSHWCRDCLGKRGPGSPCMPDEPEATDEDDQ